MTTPYYCKSCGGSAHHAIVGITRGSRDVRVRVRHRIDCAALETYMRLWPTLYMNRHAEANYS